MKYRTLGRTGVKVSEIGHGLWGMGEWSDSDDATSRRALQRSADLGCNFYDSAWAYGNGKSDGLLGELIRNNPNKRIFAASKIPPKNLKWPASSDDPVSAVYPADHILDYTEKIRRAMRGRQIDLIQFHVWDDSWSGDENWQRAIQKMKNDGLIRFFGISLNRWEPENGIKAIETGLVDVVQVIYNIFDQAPEDKLFPLCRKKNIGVVARVPLDEGSLGGKMTLNTRFPPTDWRARYFGPENLPQTIEHVERLKKVLPRGMSLPTMALRFILSNPDVSTTIIGMRHPDRVEENIRASGQGSLEPSLIATLREHRWDREVAPWSD
jgi:aryl-alcohol dehydrogenase-like predicted oxidoreductase